MANPTEYGHKYRRRLPHFRTPGAIYHARMRIDPSFGWLETDQEFEVIQDSILYVHRRTCIVIAYVIMPDHAHLAVQPRPRVNTLQAWCDYRKFHSLESILGSIKKYTSRRLNSIRRRSGSAVRQEECFDRTVRNHKDLDDLVDYIQGNPVRWKLVKRPEEYRWSSASTIYSGKAEYLDWFRVEDFVLA